MYMIKCTRDSKSADELGVWSKSFYFDMLQCVLKLIDFVVGNSRIARTSADFLYFSSCDSHTRPFFCFPISPKQGVLTSYNAVAIVHSLQAQGYHC